MFLRCQTESKTIENMLHNFCSQELQDGTGTDWARSAWKLLHIKVDLSPFLLMDLYTRYIYYSFETSRSNRMMAAILNLWMRSGQEDGYLKNVHSLAGGQTVTKYSAM